MTLRIASVSQAHKAAGLPGVSGWCYLGSDVDLRDRLTASLSLLPRRDIGEALDRVARRFKPLFLDWLAALGSKQTDPLVWYTSALSSKSPLLSDFYLLVCYAGLAAEELGKDLLLVVEDPSLFDVLKQRFSDDAGTTFHGGGLSRWIRAVSWRFREPLAKAYVFLWASAERFRSANRFGEGASPEGVSPAAMIHTWIEPRSFAKPGRLSDAYTERLGDILSQDGVRVVRLTPVKFKSEFLKPLRDVCPDAVLPAAFLKFSDIWKAFKFRFKIETPPGASFSKAWI